MIRTALLALLLCCASSARTVTVAASGGDYTTVQAAIDYCALTWNGPEPCVISIDSTFVHTSSGTPIALKAQTTANKKWIILRSSRIAELPYGVRVSPADANKMPKFQKSTRDSSALIMIYRRASHYRLEGLEFIGQSLNQPDGGTGVHWSFINAYDEATSLFYTRADFPSDIVIDRCYFHGPSLGDSGLSNAVVVGGHNMAVINSYFADISSLAVESHAIAAAQPGSNLLVRNNYVSALSIGTILGGAAHTARGYTPVAAQFIGNYYTKRPEWKSYQGSTNITTRPCVVGERFRYTTPEPDESWECQGTPGQLGTWVLLGQFLTTTGADPSGACGSGIGLSRDLIERTDISYPNFWECVAGVWTPTLDSRQWTEDRYHKGAARGNTGQKNHMEFKIGRGVLAEGNYFLRSYAPSSGSQQGTVFLPKCEQNSRETFTDDVEFVSNKAVNVAQFFLANTSGQACLDNLSPKNIRVRNNLVVNTGDDVYYRHNSGQRVGVQFVNIPYGGGFVVENNTVVTGQSSPGFHEGMMFTTAARTGVVGRNNIVSAGEFGWNPNNLLPSDANFATYYPLADQRNNVMVRDSGTYNTTWLTTADATWTYLPSGSFSSAAASWGLVGFVNFAAFPGSSSGGSAGGAGDYRLCTGVGTPDAACTGPSAVLTAGTGGSRPGADIQRVEWAIAGTETGIDNPWHDFRIRQADSRGLRYTAYSTAACTVAVDDDPAYGSPLYSAAGSSGSRDRFLSAATLGLDAAPPGIYYARVTCDGGRYREAVIRHW